MAGDFRTMITDSEALLKAAASVSGEGFAAARTKFEDKLRHAKAALADASQPVFDRTMESAAVADDYVRGRRCRDYSRSVDRLFRRETIGAFAVAWSCRPHGRVRCALQ